MSEHVDGNRNYSIDMIRAIAMLMVVLGHTMMGAASDSSQSFLFQIIWTLQMPLFFMISGFVSVYSKQPSSGSDFFKKILKKTLSYMLPFFVWTFLIRGIILEQRNFFDVKFLAYNMDSGYWFLFVIWVITLVYEICSFVWKKALKNGSFIFPPLLIVFSFLLFECIFVGLGFLLGFDFVCIKLICYYLPYFCLGFLLNCFFGSPLAKQKKVITIVQLFVLVSLAAWIILIRKNNFYSLEDSLSGILLRFLASTLGSISFFVIIFNCSNYVNQRLKNCFSWIGSHTLEIYLLHSLLLNLVNNQTDNLSIMSIQGFGMIVLNFSITMVLTCLIIWLLGKNKIISKILFWK